MRHWPYPLVCLLLGLVLGWLPYFFHGPIPEKYDVLYIRGAIAVWGWYSARMLIGFWVGVTTWPSRWWLRGPLCGFLVMFPLGWVSHATPGCGPVCQFWNETTGTLVGLAVAGLAFVLTGRHHR